MKPKLLLAAFLAATCLLLFGCDYDFPLTAKPAHKIDPRLVGDWAPVDKEDAKDEVFRFADFRAPQAIGFPLAFLLGVLAPWRFNSC